MTRDRGIPPGDQSGRVIAQPLFGEELLRARRSTFRKLDELISSPGIYDLENTALRGKLPVHRAFDTNVAFLSHVLHPMIGTVLQGIGGGEMVWIDGSRTSASGAVRFSLNGIEYLDKDAKEMLSVPVVKAEGKFIWTPEGGVDQVLKDEVIASNDPSVIGFSQVRLTEFLGGAISLLGSPDHNYLARPGGRRTFLTNPAPYLFGPLQLKRDPRAF